MSDKSMNETTHINCSDAVQCRQVKADNLSVTTKQYNQSKIEVPQEIGWLKHEQTKTSIAVFSKINWFQRMMLRLCFGLIYIKKS